MKVGVVGGSGNISASFVRLLLKEGHEVACFNRGRSGGLPEGARAIHGDRRDRGSFEKAMQSEKFDAAIDMVCFDSEDAESSIRAFADVGHFIQCSTISTYGVDYRLFPTDETQPLRPNNDYGRGKLAADNTFLEAHYEKNFPATVMKPATTYGPKMGLVRQIAMELSWLDRIRKGKPILVSGEGRTLHQHMHVDDAAPAFVYALGRPHCLGQIYNVAPDGCVSWDVYHKTAMRVLGREVEMVGVPLEDMEALGVPGIELCRHVLGHNNYLSNEKLRRDIPEYHPVIGLEEGMARVIEALDRGGRIPNSDAVTWEDAVIEAQRSVSGWYAEAATSGGQG